MSKRNRNAQASEVTTLVPNENGELVVVETTEAAAEIEEASGEAEAEAKVSKRKRGLNEDDPFLKQVIFTVVTQNPKRKGSKSFARFALYVPGMTVLEFLKIGGTRGDINWDVAHKHITLAPATPAPPSAE